MSSKRRAAPVASPESSVHGQKRRKVSDDSTADVETPQTTTEAGLKLLAHIKQSTDKNGRQITTSFLHLPDKKENPDYYRTIVLPIAIDTVEEKLKRHEYPTITALESDLKRMISNAKVYNQKSSQVFADAERIRKILSNNMPKINPAYKDPKYVAFPTPLPDEAPGDEEAAEPDASPKESPDEQQKSKQRSSSAAFGKDDKQQTNFEGDSLQTAQDKIISELINLKDSEGTEVGLPFVNKPDRNLYKDYYEIIQHPVSLRTIQRQARGTDGRKTGPRTTAFPTWLSFEEEMEYIWRNARDFNEDGSEIFNYAGILEDYFKKRVAEAKRVVPDGIQEGTDGSTPRLRLRMATTKTPEPSSSSSSQRLTLRLPGQKSDGTPKDERTQPGVTVDSEALKRQQELVRAGSNGQDIDARSTPSTRNLRRNGSPKLGARFQIPPERRGSSSAPSPARSTTTAVKSEGQAVASPNLAAVQSREDSQESMRPAAGTTIPLASQSTVLSPPDLAPPNVTGSPSIPVDQPAYLKVPQNVSFDSIWEGRDRSLANALLTNVSVFTHPSLELRKALKLDIPPSAVGLQQSITINLPSTHNYLLIRPTTVEETPQRQIKLVASVGSQKIPLPVHTRPPGSSAPVYEVRLNRGVTRVDLEVVAGPSRTVSRNGPPGTDIEYERLTIFFHLLRQ
ncbi:hypothetical protein DTO164E3_6741 [Paecilomyces variotii]|uniref:Bromodomain-containing protein n=1 Tax=Byssochlamys spectabilis TaxID=264951 RepID=A0A443HZQ2_BYSSP|nr:Bromodomain-containing protein [Paecilomyces variotii]KAJ9192076.1 hypothetical protein DTO032I3_8476 [Paecilomyces variotii]KAJ9195428.1 hypothetical protein DTO164E3_6741 [Paecilomyces variotii]KAJ9242523.1 hypothetical protein DTO169E5_3086 [Paecilomyces variotii]KAJ9274278.1 hypothetical protein DTO021D3_8881 [Paecilomyces variotii]KAJ9284020.1 hypothetical protein DTO021C3_8422 [Paecilomyces variotii]